MRRVMSRGVVLSFGAAAAVCFAAGLSVASPDDKPPPLKLGEERVPENEADEIQQLVNVQKRAMEVGAKHFHELKGARGQHPKQHACVKATFVVRDDIPSEYKVGILKEPKSFEARIRFSNGGQFQRDDGDDKNDPKKGDVHGMAIKLLNVDGPRAFEGDGRNQQDFLLVDSETFFTRDLAVVRNFIELTIAKRSQDVERMKQLGATLQKDFPGDLKRIQESRKDIDSPLTINYFAPVPYKLGSIAVKYKAVPVDVDPPKKKDRADASFLRAAITERLMEDKKSVEFDFFIIAQKDAKNQPVEDPTVDWEKAGATPVHVARVTIEPQDFTHHDQECAQASFDPWNALADHRPLGNINRARKVVYPMSFKTRRESSGTTP